MNNTMKWILFLIAVFVIYKILSKIGIIDTLSDVKADKLASKKAFDPKYYKTLEKEALKKRMSVVLLTKSAAGKLAEKIYNAKGIVKDTDEQALAQIRQLKYLSQISFLSEVFADTYNRDLGAYLDFMSDDNKALLSDYIKNLPTGLIK